MSNPRGTPENLTAPTWKPGQSGNPKGKPKGRNLWRLTSEQLEANDGELLDKAAKVLAQKIARGNLRCMKEFSDRVYGPIVRRLEIDHRQVVGIVAVFEVACREIVGEENARLIAARTREMLEAGDGTEPATDGTASEPSGSVPAISAGTQAEPVREVRE